LRSVVRSFLLPSVLCLLCRGALVVVTTSVVSSGRRSEETTEVVTTTRPRDRASFALCPLSFAIPPLDPGLSPERPEQCADLVVDLLLGRFAERGGDLGAEGQPVAAAEPLHGGLDGDRREAQLVGQDGVGDDARAVGQDGPQPLEGRRPAGLG